MAEEETPTLNTPEIKALATRLLEGALLAAERAVAQIDSPGSQAFPRGATSLEAILLKRLQGRPPAKRAAAAAWRTSRRGRPRHPAVTGIDLGLATPVMEQLRTHGPAITISLETLRAEGFPMPLAGTAPAPVEQQIVYDRLMLRVSKLECLEETDGGGDDEITLTGVGVAATGFTHKLPKIFDEALFTDGPEGVFTGSPAQRERSFSPPRPFATFTFAADDTVELHGGVLPVLWPRHYQVLLAMAEIDNGDFPEFVEDIFIALTDEAGPAVKAAIAGAIGAVVNPVLGVIVAALVWVAGKITQWIMSEFTALVITIWEDDTFVPWPSTIKITGAVDPFSGQVTDERAKTVTGHGGRYRLHYDWHLDGAHAATPLDTDILTPGATLWHPASRQPRRLELAMRGLDRGAFRAFEVPGGWSGWGEPVDPSGTFLSAPTLVSWAHGRLELFALGDDARIWQNSLRRNLQGDEMWTGWSVVPGTLFFRFGPAAVSRQANSVDLFAVAADRRMYRKEWNGTEWTDWQMDMPSGTFKSGPAVTARNGILEVAALGDDRRIYHSARVGQGWSSWQGISSGTLTSAPAVCDWNDERLHVFARGDDRQIYHAFRQSGQWSMWAPDPGTGTFLSGPAAVSKAPGLIDLFAVGDDRRMWRSAFDGTKFSGWFSDFGADTFA